MNNDTGNPFRKLAEIFTARKRNAWYGLGVCAQITLPAMETGAIYGSGSLPLPKEKGAVFLAATEQNPGNSQPDDDEGMDLFLQAMQGVVPVRSKGRDIAARVAEGKKSPAADPVQALRDVLEGNVEFALRHTTEYMEGFVAGLDPLVLTRLHNGQYSPEGHLDLHRMNARQAYDALTAFIKDAYLRDLRTVVIITGRGRNSPEGIGVLRQLLPQWLSRDPFKRVVLAFCTARPCDGGSGAVYVLLRKNKKNRGKIIWERTPSTANFPDA